MSHEEYSSIRPDQVYRHLIAELIKKHINSPSNWPKDYFESVAGKWSGDFPEIEEIPERERDWPE